MVMKWRSTSRPSAGQQVDGAEFNCGKTLEQYVAAKRVIDTSRHDYQTEVNKSTERRTCLGLVCKTLAADSLLDLKSTVVTQDIITC